MKTTQATKNKAERKINKAIDTLVDLKCDCNITDGSAGTVQHLLDDLNHLQNSIQFN